MWPSGYGVRLRHSFCYSFCAFFLSCETRRFASLSAQFFLLNSFGFPTQKKKEIFVTRKEKRNLLYKKRPITNINNMSDNEGGDATAEVDFNDDLFTCANVRLFVHMCTCLCIDLFTLSLSLSLSLFAIFFLFCSVAPGEFDIFATAKAASSPSLTLLFLLLLLLLPFTTRNNYKHSQMSSPSTRLLPIA